MKLKLKNQIVTAITFEGEANVYDEIRGIVIENNPDMGYITIRDNKGALITKSYNEGTLTVEKQEYYDTDDEIGYIDQVFPNFKYDPRDTSIDSIEVGDIVFIKLSPYDSEEVENISAAVNYSMKYGKVKTIEYFDMTTNVLVEYENKQTAIYEIPYGVHISRDGKPVTRSEIKLGDWVKMLVNEAIIEPGYITESVKEITLESAGHLISNLIKGNLAGVDMIQNKIILDGAEILTKAGWNDYKDLRQFDISGNDVEYYYGDKRVSLDYINKYLKHSDAMAYVALEGAYSGEKVKKVTFRLERDEILPSDMVYHSNSVDEFRVLTRFDEIKTDAGTIVRRHGRLVDGKDIFSSDYVKVVMNGYSKAAIVDIVDAPDTSEVIIARGRVSAVNEKQSFKVESMSMLSGTRWLYTPIQREFTIDRKTLFISEEGGLDYDKFLGYTEDSVLTKVYNIVINGDRAAYIVDAPYANRAVRGTVYKTEGEVAFLKDATVQDVKTGMWRPVSHTNNIMQVTMPVNCLVAKDNKVVFPNKIEVGDQLMVMTDNVPVQTFSGMELTGYVVVAEK